LLHAFIGFLINKRVNLGGIIPMFAPLTSSRRHERSITLANASRSGAFIKRELLLLSSSYYIETHRFCVLAHKFLRI